MPPRFKRFSLDTLRRRNQALGLELDDGQLNDQLCTYKQIFEVGASGFVDMLNSKLFFGPLPPRSEGKRTGAMQRDALMRLAGSPETLKVRLT